MYISDMNTVCAKTPSNQIIQSHLPTFIGWWKLPLLHWNVYSWEKYEKVVNGPCFKRFWLKKKLIEKVLIQVGKNIYVSIFI